MLRRGADRILFDCGEGTQRQLVSSVGLTELTEIYVTHFHADHWLGLPGLLKTFDLRVLDRDGYKVAPVPVAHRVSNAFGYVLYEDPRPGEFDPEVAAALGIVEGPE